MTDSEGAKARAGTDAAAAETLDARLSCLYERLDTIIASWEAWILSQRAPQSARVGAVRRAPGDVLAEVERELRAVERQCADRRSAAETEARAAAEWEGRAVAAVHAARDDLARRALTRHQAHAAAAELAAEEVAALEAVCETYRDAVAAVRATVPPAPS